MASLIGYRITRINNVQYFKFEALLYYYLSHYNSITFVQVGGCDGTSFDPLYPILQKRPDAFKGIILEPIADYFDELHARYKDNPKITPLRYAIHNSLDEAVLYRPDPRVMHKLPSFAKGSVSFDKSHLEKFNLSPNDYVEEKVPCKTLAEVMKEHDIENPDLLLMDTEGYDAEILLNYNFEKYRPSIIRFEHGLRENLTSRDQLEKLFEKLHSYQYELIFDHFDATAIHRELLLSITE